MGDDGPKELELKCAPGWHSLVEYEDHLGRDLVREVYCPRDWDARKEQALSYRRRISALEYLRAHERSFWARRVRDKQIAALNEQVQRFLVREEMHLASMQAAEMGERLLQRILGGAFGGEGDAGPTIH